MSLESKQSVQPNDNDKVSRVLKKVGYSNSIKISDTLQGSIWRATHCNKTSPNTETSVIKVTHQDLHKQSISIVKDKKYRVHENILWEQNILKYLTECKNFPNSITKFQRFFRSNTAYYLAMEDGGSSLFLFIKKAHQIIADKKIEINHWKTVVKVILKQMIECIEFIHSKNVCHFDISLENFVINDVQINVTKMKNAKSEQSMVSFVTDDIQIKLCDFGLSQIFASSDCMSSKYCGKTNYKSPEILSRKKQFDAKKNDIWSLGVCLFMMMVGTAPFNVADDTDAAFMYIMRGKMVDLLKGWNVSHCIDESLIDLLESIFKYETDRIDLNTIKQHSWI